jgi:chloride channel 7
MWAPQCEGSGLPVLKTYLNGIHQRKRWATGPALVAKSIAITLVVSTALPLGKEGPMVHVGAMAGAVGSRTRRFGLDRFFELKLPKNQREWVGMGAAAGVAAAFNAPLGGILYSFEEVCSSWSANVRVTFAMPRGAALGRRPTGLVHLGHHGAQVAYVEIPKGESEWE